MLKQIIVLLIIINSCCIYTHQHKTYSSIDVHGNPFDHMLINMMNITDGVFLEVGAFDGIEASNTKLLEEEHNWTGILIEPSLKAYQKLVTNRPNAKCFNCALGSFEEDNTYAYGDFEGHTMSSLTNRLGRPNINQVLIRSLQSVLDECGIHHIHFFSLDTEGYELNILKGINFNVTTFDYILIEIYKHQYDEIITLLNDNGYTLVTCLSNYNKELLPGWDGTHNDYLFTRKH